MEEEEVTKLGRALERQRVLKQLLEHPGWLRVVAIAQEQADHLQGEILFTPCLGIDSAMAQEYKKGQLEGRLCLSSLIQAELDVCASTILNLRRQQDGSSDGSGSSSNDRAAP